jgi:diguanylate cyclase (GGDEF)-like protein
VEGRKTVRIDPSMFDDPNRGSKHAALIVLRGEELGRDFRLRKKGMIIGRDPTADICIPDDGASRGHASVDYRGTGADDDATYVLSDLGSTNHTFVNSHPVKSVTLRDGDKIQIGDTILKFVVLDSVEATFHAEVRDRISYDQLTGLLTKESLYLAFERELERCLRYRLPLSVLMMDLDHFKKVNDSHGHLMGSHVLAEVGTIIRQATRTEDISARYGGEEFVSYLAEIDTTGALVAAERIRTDIEDHIFVLDDLGIRVTISLGIATAPGHGATLKELVAAADRALYHAKKTGRNRICIAE